MKFLRYIRGVEHDDLPGFGFRGVMWDGYVIDLSVLKKIDPGVEAVVPFEEMVLIREGVEGQDTIYVGDGPNEWERLRNEFQSMAGQQWRDWKLSSQSVILKPPIRVASFRDFYAFEDHVRSARKNRGLDMIQEWYEAPVFYFSNVASIIGPNAEVKKPAETEKLDYEVEIGFVIGREGTDIPVDEADNYIAGFTIINDWSMRDIQRREMKVGLGPCKSKDFATSIGPWLVTPDELEDRVIDRSRGKRYDLTMTASVNGKEYSRGNTKDIHWTFAELIAEASRNTTLRPGDLIGSGTVGTGCIVEFPEGTYPWLQPGDVVRLEIEGLGVLENRIV